MYKLLITGASGLLGSNLAKLATPKFNVYATYNTNQVEIKNVNFFQADLRNKEDFIKIDEMRPDSIIHCAALTNIDYCEGHAQEAYEQNVTASIYVAEAAKKAGSYLVYISTDAVFGGEKGGYKEDDQPKPVNVYGKTKLEAEQKILSIWPYSCVIRTNFYGWNKIDKFSLAEWMLNKLTNKEELPGLEDIYFSPIFVNHFIDVLFKLQEIKYRGVIHVAGSESCTKLGFAYKLAQVFGLDSSLIKPVGIRKLGLSALRGKNTSLNVSKVEKILKEHLPGIEEGLRKMKELCDKGYVKELKYG